MGNFDRNFAGDASDELISREAVMGTSTPTRPTRGFLAQTHVAKPYRSTEELQYFILVLSGGSCPAECCSYTRRLVTVFLEIAAVRCSFTST